MNDERSSLLAQLEEVADGLLYQSEADYPLEPFVLESDGSGPAEPRQLLHAMGYPDGTPVRTVSLSRFFAPAVRKHAWHNPEERETARRFQALVKTLQENLTGLQVFKVGHVPCDVYVVGRTPSGALAGVKTKVVET